MPAYNPKITHANFLFPYRWLKEDRQFLGENIVRQIKKCLGNEGIDNIRRVQSYWITIAYQSYLPVTFTLSRTELQKFLKPILPNGKCLDVQVEYTQHKSRTMLPIMDFQIYFE